MREWLRRWLDVPDVRALSARVVDLADSVGVGDSDINAITKQISEIKDRLTAIETGTKNVTAEKPKAGRGGGWSTQKRAAQKDAEWRH